MYELDRPSSYWTANGINIGYRKIWIWLDHVCERHTSVFKIVSQCWWLVTKTNKLLKSYQRIEGGTKKLWTNGFFHAQPKHEGYFQRHGNLMSLVTFLGSLENTRKKYWKRNETFMWFMSLRCRFSHAQTTNDLFNFYESGYFSDGKRHKYFSKYLSSIIHFSQTECNAQSNLCLVVHVEVRLKSETRFTPKSILWLVCFLNTKATMCADKP